MKRLSVTAVVLLAAVVLLPQPGLALAADAAPAVDFSPILIPIIQALGGIAAVVALPVLWFVVNLIRSKLNLSKIDEDNALRIALDAGLQKSVGSGISRVQEAVAGLPMTVNTKNAVIQQAAAYAKATIGDTLKAAKLDTTERLQAAIEARLGVMEMQTSTGQAQPGVPATAPAAQSAAAIQVKT